MSRAVKSMGILCLAIGLMLNLAVPARAAMTSDALMELSLAELLDIEVTSASNRAEKLSEAPSTVIVITREDIGDRGYHNLIDVLQDLPGMDVVVSYGDDYVRNYWRGYRNSISAPYLLMIDGVIFNHLYLNSAGILATFPLSNIERIEFVYGPASSVYGANAFMGVMNVITRRDSDEAGANIAAGITYGASNDRKIGDLNMFYKKGDFRVSLSGRIESGNVRGDDVYDNFEWTKDKYYADPTLWGGFLTNPNVGGKFSSPIKNRAIDFRGFYDGTELGIQYFSLNSGYGYSYPADKGQNHAIWEREEKSIFLRHQMDVADYLSSTTLLRYRESNITNDSYFVENWNGWVDWSYWQSLNSSWSLFQDLQLDVPEENLSLLPEDRLSVLGGLKYEQKDLQKAYDINYGPSVLPSDLDEASDYSYPNPPPDSKQSQNRITTEDLGLYLNAKYSFEALGLNHHLHIGGRWDRNSEYGAAITLRGGYIGILDGVIAEDDTLVAKLLYGEAYQEPSARQLFGGWTGTGSDPDLDPEKSRTYELSVTYALDRVSTSLSFYTVENYDTILTLADGARNVGERRVHGLDCRIQAHFAPPGVDQLKLWAFYSYIHGEGDEVYVSATDSYAKGQIGDLANHKFFLGATGVVNEWFTATLRGRYIGERDTVATNPIRSVDDYFVADAYMRFDLVGGLSLSLNVDNIFDAEYEHPGIRSANSGGDPGSWDGGGVWQGSQGWFNSLVPQPGRSFWLSLNFSY